MNWFLFSDQRDTLDSTVNKDLIDHGVKIVKTWPQVNIELFQYLLMLSFWLGLLIRFWWT